MINNSYLLGLYGMSADTVSAFSNASSATTPRKTQPTAPWAIGVKVGRQHADVLLVDFLGRVHHREGLPYAWPDPEHLPAALLAMIRRCREALSARMLPLDRPERLCGIGVAAPLSIACLTRR